MRIIQYSHVRRKLFFILGVCLLIVGLSSLLIKYRSLTAQAYSSDLFVTTWKTNVAGATEPNKVTLSFQPLGGTAYYMVSWRCNDDYDVIWDAKTTHTYESAGTYDICVKSGYPLAFNSPGLAADEKTKLQEIKQWGNVQWSSFKSAFSSMTSMKLTASDVPDLSAVTDMSSAFENTNFTGHESMSRWNTSNVTNMNRLFRNSTKFNGPVGSWNTSNVTNMAETFYQASTFNQDLTSWDLGNVTSTSHMFYRAHKFNNGEEAGASGQSLDWSTGKVENMSGMFRVAVAFNQPVGGWNTSNVTNMERVFDGASRFNQPLGDWNTSKVTTMLAMFQNAYAFNQDLKHFNTASVKDMNSMFWSAKKFNQDLSSWNVSNVTTLRNLLENTSFTTENYEKLLISWGSRPVKQNVLLGAQGLSYCSNDAVLAHDRLTNAQNNWNITDAGKNCPPHSLQLKAEDFYENTTYVGKILATDPENGGVNYSLVNGDGDGDNAKFTLDFNSGDLAFIEAPDFEAKASAAETNDYAIRVRATDATGLFTEKSFIITVLDADDVPPVITIFPGKKTAEGDIDDTTFTVSDRFSIKNVEVDKSSVAAAEDISCTPAEGSSTNDNGFPYRNTSDDPEHNHLTLNCTITIKSSGKLVLWAIDEAGYSSTKTEEGYIIDTLGPTFTVANVDTTSPYDFHNPMVRFKAVSPVGVEKYEVTYTDRNQGEKTVDVGYTEAERELAIELDPNETPHLVIIKAHSKAGKTTTRRITFPAEVTINAPTIISNEIIDNTTVKIVPLPEKPVDTITIGGSAYIEGVTALGPCTDEGGSPAGPLPYSNPVICQIKNIKKTGMIEVQAKYTDSLGGNHLIGSNQQKYFYDTEKPEIIINAPTKVANSNITNIAVTITDNVEMYTDDAKIDPNSTAAVTEEGLVCQPCSIDRRKLNCTATVTSSGYLIVRATDKAGNTHTATETGFMIDNTPPVVEFDELSYINSNNQTNYTLSGSCTAGDSNLLVTIGGQPHTTACGSDNKWTLTTDLSSYTDGTIAISAKQTDTADNEGIAEGSLTKDTETPTGSFTGKTTNVTSPVLTGLVSEETAKVRVIINGNSYNATNKGNGTWELPAGDVSPLADGTYTVDLVISDDAGNANTYSYASALTIDTARPTVTINQADTQADPTNINRAEFTVKFSKNVNQGVLSAYSFTIEGSAGTATLEKVNGSEYKLIVTDMASGDTVKVNLPENMVQDLAGNFNTASISNNNSVTFDDTAPVGTINAVRPTTITQPGFNGEVDDKDAKITVKVAGDSYIATNKGNGTWELPTGTINELVSGDYVVEVDFIDKAGNRSTRTTSLAILSKEVSLGGQAGNRGKTDTVNQATIEVLSGTCQAGVVNANSLKGGLTAPEDNITIVGGITYKLSCEKLGGNATVDVTLGQYYANLSLLRIYKQQDGNLIDITSSVNLRNEAGQTKLTITLVDGADYDEDEIKNYEILDPLYVGVYQNPLTTSGLLSKTGFNIFLVIGVSVLVVVVAVINLGRHHKKTDKSSGRK